MVIWIFLCVSIIFVDFGSLSVGKTRSKYSRKKGKNLFVCFVGQWAKTLFIFFFRGKFADIFFFLCFASLYSQIFCDLRRRRRRQFDGFFRSDFTTKKYVGKIDNFFFRFSFISWLIENLGNTIGFLFVLHSSSKICFVFYSNIFSWLLKLS